MRIHRLLYNVYMEGRSIASRHDWLYRPLIRGLSVLRPKDRAFLASTDTEIVIEGFPRSANTYFVAFFAVAQGRPVRIARHLHESYQVRFAEKQRIPCVVLVRQPLDALVSALMRDTRKSPTSILRNYLRFYREVLRIRKMAVIASFDTAINDANLIIEEVNGVYGTSFALLSPHEIHRVPQEVEAMDREAFDTKELDPLRIASPSEQKRIAKAQIEIEVREHCQQLLLKAERLHLEVERSGVRRNTASSA